MRESVPSKLPVEFANFKHLSEQFVKSIDAEITEAFRDCNNRPKLKKPRTITIKLTFTPVVDAEDKDSECAMVDVGYHVTPTSRPARVPEPSRVKINKNNQGFFHADFPQDPTAKGMFDEQVAKK